jgi:hypothetical protein
MTTFEIPLLVSSNELSGAYNVNSGKSKWDVSFPQDIVIPKNARNVTVECSSATIWYTSYNISSALGNNKFYLDVDSDAIYTVTINDGLYDLSSLAHAINVGLVNQGLASSIITFTGDTSSQKVVINFTIAGLRVDFTGANSCRLIMGFSEAVFPASYTTSKYSVYGDLIAAFNTVDYYILHTDLINAGITINGRSSSSVARVLITSAPGTQLEFEPNNAIKIQAQNLSGSRISKLHVWITDQSGNYPEFTDHSSLLLVIKYTI